ncbi:hypothetical protein SUGI_0236650 [Cryptomeria japonica]|nr:hypothetical protein SUGI_0236650 [Cryptomeria japonica]
MVRHWNPGDVIPVFHQIETIANPKGCPNNDHKCWERPEDIYSTRTACKIDSQNPSSDVVAEIATALAVASLVFHKTNFSYSKRLIYASMTDELLLKKVPRLLDMCRGF